MCAYSYKAHDCDVSDRASLLRFRDKRLAWVDWLDNDQHHAIWDILGQMVWNEVSFSTLARIVDGDSDSSLGNPLLVDAVLNGHVAMQVLAIRRLTDTSNNVVSVSKLLKDIRRHLNLLTRENYVSFDGLPYDYERVEALHREEAGPGFHYLETAGPLAFGFSRLAHERFDRLSGIDHMHRRRDDRLPVRLINTIEGWITDSGANEIATWSHKYLAHAGTPASREEIAGYRLNGLKIRRALKGLAQATEAVSAFILGSSSRSNGLLATPQYDQFERLDNPALSLTNGTDPHSVWKELALEYDGCLDGVEKYLVGGASLPGN